MSTLRAVADGDREQLASALGTVADAASHLADALKDSG
jgi:hypothetical protein